MCIAMAIFWKKHKVWGSVICVGLVAIWLAMEWLEPWFFVVLALGAAYPVIKLVRGWIGGRGK